MNMPEISIERLEKAINDCRLIQPPVQGVLGSELRVLATIWGEMIAKKETSLDISAQPPAHLTVLRRWLGAAAGEPPQATCMLIGTQSAECEVCQ
jgi:hypothetical protein